MTPEELNRTIEFIIQSQARLAAAQEQDRAERIEFQKWSIEFQKWSKDLNRQVMDLIQAQTQLLEIQSRRLDVESRRADEQSLRLDQESRRLDEHHDQFLELMRDIRGFRTDAQKRHEE